MQLTRVGDLCCRIELGRPVVDTDYELKGRARQAGEELLVGRRWMEWVTLHGDSNQMADWTVSGLTCSLLAYGLMKLAWK